MARTVGAVFGLSILFTSFYLHHRNGRVDRPGLNKPSLMHILHLNQRNQRNQILLQYLRDKKRKKGAQKKTGGENSPISPPLDPRLVRCAKISVIDCQGKEL